MGITGGGGVRSRIVILGGAGMLGHKLFQVLREAFPGTIATTRCDVTQPPLDRVALLQGTDVVSGVDVTEFEALRSRLRAWRPEVIVNCVGVIKQRDEARSAIPSITINSLLPHRLADAAAEWGGRVVHFSTDCVFNGRKGGYTESDPSDAEDLYGKSKHLGEVAAVNAVTLRTSIIGRELTEHRSLLDWFLSQNGRKVGGYTRAIYSGITTNEMANVVRYVIEDGAALSGLYQVVSEPISKYDLLGLIRDEYGLDIEIERSEREVCDRSMRGDRFVEASGWRAPSWPDMVRQMAADPTPYEQWGVSVLKRDGRELTNVQG
jgi:dTDP-4-dehydrorhamnose reductase